METARLKKQVALLRKMGMFNPADETFAVRRAHTAADLEAAYRLVHDTFVEKGYINQQPGGMRIRPYEMVPQTATFICEHKEQGEIVAAMSVVVDSLDMGLPSDHAYHEELDELRSQGRRVCEFTNLAVAGKYWRSNAFTALTQACLAHAQDADCDDIFIAISPGHTNFFESILNFKKYGAPRNYSGEKADIVQAEVLDLGTMEKAYCELDNALGEHAFLHDYYFRSNPFTDIVSIWSQAAQPNIRNAMEFRKLLSDIGGIEKRFGAEQLGVIKNRWVEEICQQGSDYNVATPTMSFAQMCPQALWVLPAAAAI